MINFLGQVEALFSQWGLAAVGAGLVGVPVLIHLLSRWRRRPVVWGAMRFLLEAFEKHRRRLRLEHWLLLLVRCLAVLVLAMALGGPVLERWGLGDAGGRLGGKRIYLVIDDGLSSGARMAGVGDVGSEGVTNGDVGDAGVRLDELKRWAREMLSGLGTNDRVWLWRTTQWAEADSQAESQADVNDVEVYAEKNVGSVLSVSSADALVEGMTPSLVRGDLGLTLERVAGQIEADDGKVGGAAFVVVLSDLSRGSLSMERSAVSGAGSAAGSMGSVAGGRGSGMLSALSEKATLLVNPPMQTVANVQVSAVVPKRRVLVSASTSALSVMVDVTLRRFGLVDRSGEQALEVALWRDGSTDGGGDARGNTRGNVGGSVGGDVGGDVKTVTVERVVGWSPGQSEQVVTVGVPAAKLLENWQGVALPMRVRARLTGGASENLESSENAENSENFRADQNRLIDGLAVDDAREALLEIRRHLRVMVLDDGNLSANVVELEGGFADFTPWRWLSAVLSPGGSHGETLGGSGGGFDSGVRLVQRAPAVFNDVGFSVLSVANSVADTQLDEGSNAGEVMDAVVVLRPDELRDGSWQRLKDYAARGGVVWVVAPAEELTGMRGTGANDVAEGGSWIETMTGVFGLDWEVGPEVLSENDASVNGEDVDDVIKGRSGNAGNVEGWRLNASRRPPEVLGILSTDWEAMLRPVRVMKRYGVIAPADDRWLEVSSVSSEAKKEALLAGRGFGRGYVLLLSSAISTKWTNLPTKPLFVPMWHEALRGLVGRVEVGGEALVGERARLDGLAERRGGGDGDVGRTIVKTSNAGRVVEVGVKKMGKDGGMWMTGVLNEPGVYRGEAGMRLLVNIDGDGGNTEALDAGELGMWLSSALGVAAGDMNENEDGGWMWLDPEGMRDATTVADRRGGRGANVNVGWMLLWVVLGLLILETMLARWFSHAKTNEPTLVMSVWRGLWRRVDE